MPLAAIVWLAGNLPSAAAYAHAVDRPRAAQEGLLRAFLRRDAATAWGRAYGFADVAAAPAMLSRFQERLPIVDPDELAPWLGRVAAGEPGVLTADPVLLLEPTSGTTGAARLVPYTAGLQRSLRRAIAPWIVDLHRRHPRLALGSAYWAITPPSVGASPAADATGGPPTGFADDAAYLGGLAQRLVDATLAVPSTVARIADLDGFRHATLLHLLARPDLALVSVWHPSFLELLLDTLAGSWDALLADLAVGVARHPAIPRGLLRPLRPRPRRASMLAGVDPADVARIWPRLSVVSCWADAHAALGAAALARRLPGVELEPKGLLATEGAITIPYRGQHPLALRSHVVELELDGGDGRPRFPWELREGDTGTVLLSNGAGLWRYRLGDRVVVDGFVGRTPSLRFLGKTGNVCDLRGEKLAEPFVAAAIAAALTAAGCATRFALLAPETPPPEGPTPGVPRYALHVELPPDGEPRHRVELTRRLAGCLEQELAANPHYRLAVALGQLAPAEVAPFVGDGYARYAVAEATRGRRLGNLKPLALSPRQDWRGLFEAGSACR